MQGINRSTLMKAHALLAAFILPVAIMFFVTGALYTWGIKGGYDTSTYELTLEAPLQADLVELLIVAKNALKQKNIHAPSGHAKVKRIGSSFMLEWTGSIRDITLEPTSKPLIAKLSIKNTTWHRRFVQLHKAKGGTPFKVYAALFSAALLLILLTGFTMAWMIPSLRKLTMVATSLGVAVFLIIVASS